MCHVGETKDWVCNEDLACMVAIAQITGFMLYNHCYLLPACAPIYVNFTPGATQSSFKQDEKS